MGRSLTRLLMLAMCATFALALASCGGGSGGDATATPEASPTPAGTTVTSDDGLLSLFIPNGAMPEGTAVTITAVPLEELPDALQELRGAGDGYLLEPDGLTFSEPVVATLRLEGEELATFLEADGSVAMAALVSLSSDGERALLENLETQYSLEDGTLVARGELTHLSWLSRTKGALAVSLEVVPRQQLVGSSFAADSLAAYSLFALGRGEETPKLVDVAGVFSASGGVSTSGTATFGGGVTLDGGNSLLLGFGTFMCDRAGLSSYSVRVTATSVVSVEDKEFRTPLRIVLDSVVECVNPPTATPTPAADAMPAGLRISMGCDHRIPGEETDVIVVAMGLAPGQTVSGTLARTKDGGTPVAEAGVIGDGTFTATADAQGRAEARVAVNRREEYAATVNGVTGVTQVGEVCEPPAEA